ncbi:MAG: AAA family ATPase [Elusimicrobiota bacterium]
MAKRIEKLSLTGFRGASIDVDLPFDAAKPITMIFGENGTGKSSIIDALDFVCNKEFGSVAEKSGTNPKEHVVALKKTAKDLKVSLQYDGSVWTGVLDKGLPSVAGPTAPPRARILRRGQIQEVVTAPPADRYKALQSFIVPPKVEGAERALRDCVLSFKGDLDSAVRAKTQSEDALNGSWIDAGKPGKDAQTWAKERAQENEADLTAVAAEAKGLHAAMDRAQASVESWTAALKVNADAVSKQEKAHKAVEEAEKESKESDLVELLTAAQKYLPKTTKPDECPLCERPGISLDDLLKRIGERLAAMKRMVILKQEFETARKAAEKSATVLEQSRAALVSATQDIADAFGKSKLPEISNLKLDWAQYPAMRSPETLEVTDAVLKEAQKLQLAAKPCYAAIKAKQETATRAAGQLSMLKRALASVEENGKKAQELDAKLRRAQAILLIVEKRRKDFVDAVLVQISTEVGDLCEKLHPGEGIKVRLYLNPKRAGSLESEAEFEGVKDVPPQAYYSESHLDTLGVCIFLALAKKYGGKDVIVVLDDVVTSVDAPHMGRFLDLLLDQAEHFGEIIVATHYRPWLERVRHGKGPAAGIHILHLSRWTLAHGIRHGIAKLAIRELKDAAVTVPLDRQAVASKAGIFLESLLDQLALLYGCRLPRRPEPEYTLGELLDCFGKKLRPTLKCEVHAAGHPAREIVLKPILDALAEAVWIRNQVGCHWNMGGFDVPDKDVQEFVEKTIALAEALLCAVCGALPTRPKGGTHLHCRCAGDEGLKLYPLENPDR